MVIISSVLSPKHQGRQDTRLAFDDEASENLVCRSFLPEKIYEDSSLLLTALITQERYEVALPQELQHIVHYSSMREYCKAGA